MKKILMIIFVFVFSLSMLLIGISCKEEAVEEAEEAVEEAEEAVEEAETTAEEEISGEVSFATYWGSGAEAEAVDEIANMFMKKYPKVTIKIIPNDSDTILSTVTMNLSSSEPWDTFMYWMGIRTATLAKAGLIAPLDEIFNVTKYDEIAPNVSAQSRYENRLGNDSPYCLPINLGTYVVFYNIHVWENAGLTEKDIPKTWEEFIKVLDAIEKSGVPPIVRGSGIAGYPTMIWFEQFLLKTAGTQYRSDLEVLKASWDDDRFKEVGNFWDVVAPYWHKDVNTLKYDEAYTVFAKGEAGIQMIGDWILGSYETDMGLKPFEDYSAFQFPVIDPNIPKTDLNWMGNALALSTSGAKKEAAVKWMEFWATPEVQEYFASKVPVKMAISSVKSNSSMIEYIKEITAGTPSVLEMQNETEISVPIMDIMEQRALGLIDQDEAIKQLERLRASIEE